MPTSSHYFFNAHSWHTLTHFWCHFDALFTSLYTHLIRTWPSQTHPHNSQDTPTCHTHLTIHVALTIHCVPVRHYLRHQRNTSMMELCLKWQCYHCWDHRHWIHKLTTSYSGGLPKSIDGWWMWGVCWIRLDGPTTSEDATGLQRVEWSLRWASLITGKNWLASLLPVAAADRRMGRGETMITCIAFSDTWHTCYQLTLQYIGILANGVCWATMPLEPLPFSPIMGWWAPRIVPSVAVVQVQVHQKTHLLRVVSWIGRNPSQVVSLCRALLALWAALMLSCCRWRWKSWGARHWKGRSWDWRSGGGFTGWGGDWGVEQCGGYVSTRELMKSTYWPIHHWHTPHTTLDKIEGHPHSLTWGMGGTLQHWERELQ